MRHLVLIAAAILLAINMSPAMAQNGEGGNGNCTANCPRGAPGPVMGAGLPVLAIGFGVYSLVKRRRETKSRLFLEQLRGRDGADRSRSGDAWRWSL
jgi:hypothetical protein